MIALNPNDILALLATVNFGAYAMSLDQRIVFWNQGAEQILGYSADEVLGRRCYETLTGMAPGALTPACLNGCPSIRALQRGTTPHRVELEMRCASGERKTVRLTPMIICQPAEDAPLMVHLFDEEDDTRSSEQMAESVRAELSQGGTDVVSHSPPGSPAAEPAASEGASLTARELEVLQLVALGRSTSEIATSLRISEHTVRNHVRHFRGKLNASTKLEAVLTALRSGLLEWT